MPEQSEGILCIIAVNRPERSESLQGMARSEAERVKINFRGGKFIGVCEYIFEYAIYF